MTVSSAYAANISDGDGVSVIFPVTFRFDKAADVRCTIYDAAGVPRTPTFIVTGTGDPGGSVEITSGAPLVGEKVVRERATEIRQLTNYTAGNFPSAAHERTADRLTMAAQDREAIAARTLRFGPLNAPIASIGPVALGRTLVRTADGFAEGPDADEIQAAQSNAVATAADRVQTGLDRVATAADRVQTGLDRVATAADRVQTGLDRTASEAAAIAAEASADRVDLGDLDTAVSASAASATAAAGSATGAAGSATAASSSAAAALTSQTAAAGSATAASGSATTAAGSATGAAGSATAASGSAAAALNSQTAAAGSATAASGSATAAAGSATGAAGSASAAAADRVQTGLDAAAAAVSAATLPDLVANAGANLVVDALYEQSILGTITPETVSSPTVPQRGLKAHYVARSGSAGYSYPVLELVNDQFIAATLSKRALRMRHLRGSSGTTFTDVQVKQLLPIPAALLGRSDIAVRLVFLYRRQSANVNITATIEAFSAAKAGLGTVTATKVSSDVTGSWAVAIFTATITNTSAAFLSAAPRFQVAAGDLSDVDEDAWLGPIWVGLQQPAVTRFDRNGAEHIDLRVATAYPEAVAQPWMAGQNAVINGDIADSTIGQTTPPPGYLVTSGGGGTIGAAYEVVSIANPLGPAARVLEVDHYKDASFRTDRQFRQIIDIPAALHGVATTRARIVQHVKRSSLLIDASVTVQAMDAAEAVLATLTPVDLTPHKGPVDQWMALAWEVVISNTSARKLDVRWRTQVPSTAGTIAGITSHQTGFFVGWDRGADAVAYDRNLPYETVRTMKPVTDALDARLDVLEGFSDITIASDRVLDAWGNARPVLPAARLGIWGDSQTDAMEEILIAAVADLTGAGFGIGGETSAQVLARMQGYQADVTGLVWTAGTKRLRAKRCIPARVINETYRAFWVGYAAKIAEPAYVEFFNRFGRIAQTTTRLRATATVSGDTWTAVGHPFANGDVVHFRQASGPSNSYRYKPYYVRDVATNTYKLSEFTGDAAISFAAFGSPVEWLGDWYYDWSYDGSDDTVISVRTRCPTDDEVIHLAVGTNDFGTGVTVAQVCANIQASVAQIKAARARFIISGIPGFYSGGGEWSIGGARHTAMLELHSWLAVTYPDNWLDIYAHLLTEGDGGTDDNNDIAAGLVPRSLRVSSTDGHLNSAGLTAWADQIVAMMTAKGWITA